MLECTQITYNPFGIKDNHFKCFYKYTFPLGIYDRFKRRHKANNSVKNLVNQKTMCPMCLCVKKKQKKRVLLR
jgi:hypothetical protein